MFAIEWKTAQYVRVSHYRPVIIVSRSVCEVVCLQHVQALDGLQVKVTALHIANGSDRMAVGKKALV